MYANTCGCNYDNYWGGTKWCSKTIRWNNKGVIFKNCAPFTDCISKINNTQTDNAIDLNVVMPIYNLIEYSDNYSKSSICGNTTEIIK